MKNTKTKSPSVKSKTPVSKRNSNSVAKKLKTEVTSKKKKVTKKKKIVAKKQSDDKVTLMLDSVLVINNAEKIHIQLKELLKKKQGIIIDASAIEMIDTAIFQLLLSFIIKLHSLNIKVSWLNPSAEILSRAHTLGLIEEIGLGDE